MSDLRKAARAEVVAFLLGEAPLEGVWFGDRHPTERGQFWWRKHLRAALAQPDQPTADGPTRKDKQTAPSPTTSDRGLPQAVGWLGRLWNGGPKCEVYTADQMLAFRAEGVAQERERCAKVCEGPFGVNSALNDEEAYYGRQMAGAIRKG